ncbi:MAG: cell division protein FtsH, partial [Fibrobacteraceae bacterium]
CYSRADGEIFLGREINKPKEMSEKMAETIDDSINNLVRNLSQKAKDLLIDNRDKLNALGEALIENEVLDREEIDRVMEGEKLESTKKSRQYQSQLEHAAQTAREEAPPPDPGRPVESTPEEVVPNKVPVEESQTDK